MSPRSKVLSEKMRAESRSAILSSALELFAKRGYSATTTDEIARSAGVSKGLIFSYFDTKEDILLTIFEEEIFRLIPDLDEKAGSHTPRERFVSLITAVMNMLETEPLLVRLSLRLNLDDAYRKLMRKKGKHFMDLYLSRLRKLLVQLGSKTPDLDLHLLNFAFDGIMSNYAVAPSLFPPIETIKNHLIEIFLSRWEKKHA